MGPVDALVQRDEVGVQAIRCYQLVSLFCKLIFMLIHCVLKT